MLPVDTKIWGHRVPGYIPNSDSDDEDSEEEEFLAVSQERFDAVVRTLGSRWIDTAYAEFSAVSAQQKGLASLKLIGSSTAATSQYGCKLFRIQRVHAPIVTKTFCGNGLLPTNGNDWIVQWSGPGMRESGYQNLNEFQRLNHFPGSTELTRKDRLWENFNAIKQAFGGDTFDFVPESYVLPDQVDQFLDCYERSNYTWIVKPNASSQGKGIFLLRDLKELPLEECSVVSRYIDNPLLIQGLKFDLRIYVLVTSYTPLRDAFRLQSLQYGNQALQDAYRHLTNYSVNKTAHNFVENQELHSDNVGHKWSLSALNKHLKCVGVDCDLMWARIMDLIVKTLLTVEPPIAFKTRQNCVHNNCFEIYGFDVMVDNQLKPWLLEVNLSPSMQADSPLDWKVKSSLLADAFNIVGIASPDRHALANSKNRTRALQVRQATRANVNSSSPRKSNCADAGTGPEAFGRKPVALDRLSEEQLRMVAQAFREVKHCRNFIRLHPTRNSSERYRPLWDAKGPRGCDYSEAFRSSQALAARLLASVMFGPPPVGVAVSERRLSRLRYPLGMDTHASQLALIGSGKTDELSDPEKYELQQKQDHDSSRSHSGSPRKHESHPKAPPRSHSFHMRPQSRQSATSSSSQDYSETPGSPARTPPLSASYIGFRPPSMPRPLAYMEASGAVSAARMAMQAGRIDPTARRLQQRSKSTPTLPKLSSEAFPPQRNREQGRWYTRDPFATTLQMDVTGSHIIKPRRETALRAPPLEAAAHLEFEQVHSVEALEHIEIEL
eukprot:CAMPEP_0169066696 /NCGR_PEP_ID=MMETSP1015-20121227/3099_1 /TAXON_ID=342587 /ORGANISM="Karlodinium micrum, Strain CCMP2283" /LENGTH=777 /DNA_ID=CAMNT_0009125403 /DNA_START=114 /DNA_END=2448 /DNA_ORIENTATION=-